MSKLYDLLSTIIGKLNVSVKTEVQALDDAQKAQARTNIGAGSVDVASASVGQIIKVKAVDASGKPTQWEAADPLELDTTLSDSAKAAPADAVGKIEGQAAMAAHAAIIAGEGALVTPFAENFQKVMAGEAVVDYIVHLSDKVPTISDLENGYSIAFGSIFESGDGFLSGMWCDAFEIPPKALDEELFGAFTFDIGGGAIMLGEIIFIAPYDNYVFNDIIIPKKGIWAPVDINAIRINGYSFSEGAEESSGEDLYFGSAKVVDNVLTWDGDTTGLDGVDGTWRTTSVAPSLAELQNGGTITFVNGDATEEIAFTADEVAVIDAEVIPGLETPYYVVGELVCVLPETVTFPDGIKLTPGIYAVKNDNTSAYVSALSINGYTFPEETSGAVSIPDAHILYVDAPNFPTNPYLYKTADTSVESNRITAAELQSIVNSGIKINIYAELDDGALWYHSAITTAFGASYGLVWFFNGSFIVAYTAEYATDETEVSE